MTDSEATLKPLLSVNGDPIFDEAWQAEALAKIAESENAVDNQETYYNCVLSALEQLVAEHSEIDQQAMAYKRQDWEQAYLSTPHGQPVRLK